MGNLSWQQIGALSEYFWQRDSTEEINYNNVTLWLDRNENMLPHLECYVE